MKLNLLNSLTTRPARTCLALTIWTALWLQMGCGSQEEPPPVTPKVELPGPTPTEAACTPLPTGMTLLVETDAYGTVRVEVKGLLPGEEPLLLLNVERKSETMSMETLDPEPASQGGTFVWVHHFETAQEAQDAPWQGEAKIVHARGIACKEFTLP